jgi:hypothetical protein
MEEFKAELERKYGPKKKQYFKMKHILMKNSLNFIQDGLGQFSMAFLAPSRHMR